VHVCHGHHNLSTCKHAGGDRGGIQDLIDTIKKSKLPIICIANDKYNQVRHGLLMFVSLPCFGGCSFACWPVLCGHCLCVRLCKLVAIRFAMLDGVAE